MAQKRKAIGKRTQLSKFKEYKFEINVIILLGVGIFLLVEDFEIKHFIAVRIRFILIFIADIIGIARDAIINNIKLLEMSDLVGIIFITFAIFLIVNRWREKIINQFSVLIECPKCGEKLHRIHKNNFQRFFGLLFFLNIKNYKCNSCAFKGFKLTKQ